mgnify:CR=1 FL=1
MKPLNIEDRRKAFIQYLIMYVVTTALLIYAICFVCGVPGKQNAILAEKNRQLMATVSAPDKFINERNELNTLLLTVDSLNYNSLQDAMIRIQRTKGDLRNNFERDSAILGNPLAMSYLNSVDVTYKLLIWKSDKMKAEKDFTKLTDKYQKLQNYAAQLSNQVLGMGQTPIPKPVGVE